MEISYRDPLYPNGLRNYLGSAAPSVISAIGNLEILEPRKLAFFCSGKCPGNVILKVQDIAHQLKEAAITVISGFHSPVERECLRILLRGTQPIILCPVRSLAGMRLRSEYRKPIEKGRMLLLSIIEDHERRNTMETSMKRNRFVGALADAIFVAYAAPKSKTEGFCYDLVQWKKPLYTVVSDANTGLIKIGAMPMTAYNIKDLGLKDEKGWRECLSHEFAKQGSVRRSLVLSKHHSRHQREVTLQYPADQAFQILSFRVA